MDFDFAGEMQKLSDEDLIKVLTANKEDYQPKAIDAATEEFKKRNLPSGYIDNIAKNLQVERMEENRKANEPLDLILKVATFFFPFVVTFLLSGYYKVNGYDLKANQLSKWTILGFCFYFLVSIIISNWN